jgi:hypothetical protein
MYDEVGMMWAEVAIACLKVLSQYLWGEAEENYESSFFLFLIISSI